MNEYRPLSEEEWIAMSPALERCGVYSSKTVLRFVDTKLDKIYDVYLLDHNRKSILKKTSAAETDMGVYTRYFSGHDFAVPTIFSTFTVGEEHFMQMEFAEGSDARGCSESEGNRIGEALAEIQSCYLTGGGRTERAESYFRYQISKQIAVIRPYFMEFDEVFHFVEQRFFEAPQTLIHDDLLPINVLLNQNDIRIIDWEYADILPYFLDLGRFAFVYDAENHFYISHGTAEAFLKGYYCRIKQNPKFCISEKAFRLDIAISTFCQYVLFLACSLNKPDAAPSAQITESIDKTYLQNIMRYIRSAMMEFSFLFDYKTFKNKSGCRN